MRRVVPVLAAALLAGCFAVNDPEAHLPPPVPADEFCVEYARLFCDALTACDCGGGGAPAGCVEDVALGCSFSVGPLTADPRTGYDPEEMARRLAFGRTLIASCGPEFWQWGSSFTATAGLFGGFTGTVPSGESCAPAFDEEAAGRSDTPRFFSCRGDAACRRTADMRWSCLEPLGEGEMCVTGECAPGLTCQPDGRCGTERAPDGAPCDEATDCMSFRCQLGANVGHCLSTEQAYCSLATPCETRVITFFPDEAGPIVEGGRCDDLALCVDSMETVTMIEASAGGRVSCVPTPAETTCARSTPSYAFTCVWSEPGSPPDDPMGPGVLDAADVSAICAMTLVSPPTPIICANRS